MPRYDVFLSHASADKPAVEHLARKLRDEGLEPFLDKWRLIPGEPWQEALEEALDQSRTCAVVLGKTIGPWQNEEMRSALETRVRDDGFRVIPVLLPGGKEPGKEELPQRGANEVPGVSPADFEFLTTLQNLAGISNAGILESSTTEIRCLA
jgi:hypothetical protein